jgi:hypothetical protein
MDGSVEYNFICSYIILVFWLNRLEHEIPRGIRIKKSWVQIITNAVFKINICSLPKKKSNDTRLRPV